MPDQGYQPVNFLFQSKGVSARYVDDYPPPGTYALLTNLEEIEENGLATRLGTKIVNQTAGAPNPLSGSVHSLSKLAGLNGTQYRYASSGGNLYRRSSLTPGAFALISSSLNGTPWTAVQYQPSISSYPYEYIADMNGVIKDNGTLAAPQNAGIKQPQWPVLAQAQEPSKIVLDNFTTTVGYTYIGISPGGLIPVVSQFTTSPITIGVTEVDVLLVQQIGLFQLITVDTGIDQETVLVLEVTATGFIANFTKNHASGVALASKALDLTIPAATTGSVSRTFVGHPIAAWPTKLAQEDYIGIYIYASDPSQIQSITLKFDCGDGSFQSDFFWRTISQGPLQPFLDTSTDSSTAAADAVLSQSLGVFSSAAGGVTGLNTGMGQWTPILLQLSDFSSTGRAAFDSPNFNWDTVNGYQVEITTGSNGVGAQVWLSALLLFGGAGPDSFAGVAYDYLFTFFNINDYTESNPSMVMTNVDPPLNTNWILPRRQPVALHLNHPFVDPQTTHLRIYRRGGTLADNYRRIDQVPCTGGATDYTDILSDLDIQGADTVSFTNDVPVTSSLPVPVNTTLAAPIITTNALANPLITDMTNISVGQQVSIGDVTASNFETVIVRAITATTFNAFIQNTHAAGEPISATAKYAQPVGIIAVAFDQGWYAEDPNNPSELYFTPKGAIQYVSSAAHVPVSVPSDAITAIVPTSGNLFVSTQLRWWSIAPGSNATAQPTVYPTRADRGCVGKRAWCLRDGVVYYLAVDGPRIFVGGESKLISESIQFVWQGNGPTPIPMADPANFASAVVSYWNQFVIFSYTVLTFPHFLPVYRKYRLILDVEQKRWRNDDIDAESMFLEEDTNQLVYGTSDGMIHLDRQSTPGDEAVVSGAVVVSPVAINLLSPYSDQGQPAYQKNYNEFTLDANTNGADVTATLNFNDGEFTEVLGPINTTERQRINLNLNNGDGFQAYKVALQLTGQNASRIFLYQAKLKSLVLAMTRKSLDTYWLRFGTDESKIAKQGYFEYNAGATVNGALYYDDSSTPGFTFTLPEYDGLRNSLRIRFPAVKFRLFRCILTSTDDFQVWDESHFEIKPLAQGKSYAQFPMMS